MAIPTFNAVGFCANYSLQGDWAFDYALRFAASADKQLNVFEFLQNPYEEVDENLKSVDKDELDRIAIGKEKDLRLFYDEKAGDYLNVGFRVCYDKSWTELHRCLLIREFQMLVLAYPHKNAIFSGRPIEDFARNFISPVILVGPDRPDQFTLNSQAALIIDKLNIESDKWKKIELCSA